MGPKTRWAFLAVVLLQLLFLLGLAAYKEVNLRTGQLVVLQTVPVDPRDLFRGDYVILRYQVSTLSEPQVYLNQLYNTRPGDTVYVRLSKETKGGQEVWGAVEVARQPGSGWEFFLKGRLTRFDPSAPVAEVEYGIESYFVPEGQGPSLEQAAQAGTLLVRARVSGFGEAVIQDLLLDGQPWTPK